MKIKRSRIDNGGVFTYDEMKLIYKSTLINRNDPNNFIHLQIYCHIKEKKICIKKNKIKS